MEAEVPDPEPDDHRGWSQPDVPALFASCTPVPHIKQQHNWDCGLACALMVLRAMGADPVSLQDLYAECKTRSVWTVDLAHLLAKHGCKPTFLTVTVGANPEFASESFYKSSMNEDMVRVERLFREAPQAGIRVQQRSLSWQELRDLVSRGEHLAIVLVDKCKLRESGQSTLLACCCGLVSLSYTGHYVVVWGYDAAAAAFLVHDPARASASLRVSAHALDTARLSFGTDEDILIVSRALKRAELGAGAKLSAASPYAVCSYAPPLAPPPLRAM